MVDVRICYGGEKQYHELKTSMYELILLGFKCSGMPLASHQDCLILVKVYSVLWMFGPFDILLGEVLDLQAMELGGLEGKPSLPRSRKDGNNKACVALYSASPSRSVHT